MSRGPRRSRPVAGAGGVVLNRAGEVLLIRTRGGSWAFPKGHLEAGETVLEAAVREVREEGGVNATALEALGTTEYTNDRGIPRRIHWFSMRTDATRAVPEPGLGAAFVPAQAALARLSFEVDRRILRRLLSGKVGA